MTPHETAASAPLFELIIQWYQTGSIPEETLLRIGMVFTIFITAGLIARSLRPFILRAISRSDQRRGFLAYVTHFCLKYLLSLQFSIIAWIFLQASVYVFQVLGVIEKGATSFFPVAFWALGAWAIFAFVLTTLETIFVAKLLTPSVKRLFIWAFWVIVFLNFCGFMPQIVTALKSMTIGFISDKLSVWSVLVGGATFFVTFAIADWLNRVIAMVIKNTKDIENNFKVVLCRLVRVFLIFSAFMIALKSVGVDLMIFSVFGGAIGVGLGFGLQKIAANYVSGFIILFDHSVKIGDYVTINGFTGVITQINTRFSVIRNLSSGEELIVPNENFVSGSVLNLSYSDQGHVISVETECAYGSNVARALEILKEVAAKQPRVRSDKKLWAIVTNWGDSGIVMKVGFWVDDPQNGTGGIKSAILSEALTRFDAEGIEVPYTVRDINVKGSLNIVQKPAA